jgi:hypothetical protein
VSRNSRVTLDAVPRLLIGGTLCFLVITAKESWRKDAASDGEEMQYLSANPT